MGRSPWRVLKELRARRDVQKKKAAFEAEKLSANIEAKNAAAEHGLAPGQTAVEESLTEGEDHS